MSVQAKEKGEKSFCLIPRTDQWKPESIQRFQEYLGHPDIDITFNIVEQSDIREGGEINSTWEEFWVSWEEREGE